MYPTQMLHRTVNMGKQLLLVVLGLIVFGFAITSNANTYTVGDNSGWDISTNLDTWEQDKKFVVGDVLCNFSFDIYLLFYMFICFCCLKKIFLFLFYSVSICVNRQCM